MGNNGGLIPTSTIADVCDGIGESEPIVTRTITVTDRTTIVRRTTRAFRVDPDGTETEIGTDVTCSVPYRRG